MTRKRRSPAQMRAFRKMVSRNPYRHRRRRRNPGIPALVANPRRHRLVRRRRLARNPVHHYRRMRRRRNPGLLSGMITKQSLFGIAAVVGTPTLMELAASQFFPNTTGLYSYGLQALVGLGLAWGVSKFVDKEVGQIVGMVAVGTAVASTIANMTSANPAPNALSFTTGAMPLRRLGTQALGTRTNAQGQLTMSGYVPSSGNNNGNMNGYASMMGGKPRMGAAPREPGVYYF